MGFCTVSEVTGVYSFFSRNQTGSFTDEQIQGWINNRKARIRSAFLTRGFDPDNPPNALTTDQSAFLRSLNLDGAAADLGDALQGTNSLQPSEYSVPGERRKSYELVLLEIRGDVAKKIPPLHDVLFNMGPLGNIARTQDVTPQFGGIGGAETDITDIPPVLQTNVFLYKNWRP